jgi:branched-chain amino acid transport system ATP-binding protein
VSIAGISDREGNSEPPTPLLTVSNLTKRYGAMTAVNDLSFTANQGEVLGISGPNGAGKTTLFDLISCLTTPTSGSIRFGDIDVTKFSAVELCHFGIARTFQLNAVFETMTVRENLECSAYFGSGNRLVPGLRFDSAARERAREVAEMVGLVDRIDTIASSLPVLQRKLLMLGSALAANPRLLLLDEPVGGLNATEIEHCARIVRRLRDMHGMTIILIEHVMSFLTSLSDRIVILHHGSKLYEGSAAGLAEDQNVVEVYLGASGASAVKAALTAER